VSVNIPANVARHIRSGLVVTDAGASRTSAQTRMQFESALTLAAVAVRVLAALPPLQP
jgi:hypothetical protein